MPTDTLPGDLTENPRFRVLSATGKWCLEGMFLYDWLKTIYL